MDVCGYATNSVVLYALYSQGSPCCVTLGVCTAIEYETAKWIDIVPLLVKRRSYIPLSMKHTFTTVNDYLMYNGCFYIYSGCGNILHDSIYEEETTICLLRRCLTRQCGLGILPMRDPPRHDTEATITKVRAAGIGVKMITGDHLNIARKTAAQIKLGTNIYSHEDLWPVSRARDELIRRADGFAMVRNHRGNLCCKHELESLVK